MSIEISGTFDDPNFPRVLHDGNRFPVKTVIASSEQNSSFPGIGANNGTTVDRWKPFINQLSAESDLNDAVWSTNQITIAADGQTVDAGTATATHFVEQSIDLTAEEWVLSAKVERQTGIGVTVFIDDGSSNLFVRFDLTDGSIISEVNASGKIVDLGDNVFECRITFTPVAGAGVARVYFNDGTTESFTGANETMKILRTAAHISSATLRYDLFSALAGDCIAIAAHNLGRGAGRLLIEHDSNNDDAWTLIDSLEPVDDSPVMFFFDAVASSRWRIRTDRGVLPEIGVFRLGVALKFQRSFYGGFTIPRMNRNTDVTGNISGSGELLGRSKKRTTLSANYEWNDLTYAWVRANLDGPLGLIQSAEDEPLFVAWRPTATEDVEYLMRASVTAPQAQGRKDLYDFSMSGEAYAYE